MTSGRLAKLREDMEAAGEAVYLVGEAKNRRYLSGFTGSSGWLVVAPARAYLITDGRYWDQVARQCPHIELFRYLPAEHKTLVGAIEAVLQSELSLSKGARVAVEIDDMAVSGYRALSAMLTERDYLPTDVEGRVKGYRTHKDESELGLMQEAAALADAALTAALRGFQPGRSEASLKAEIDYQVLRRGGEGAAFPTIVASGINGSYPHAGASDKLISEGELITIDFGAIWRGYCSDMTRTIWYGELSEHDQNLVREVAAAQAKAVQAARPGLTTGDLDEVARASLRAAGLAEYFVHSLGHGVGLDVHEGPTLRSGQTDTLSQGQVITIEPGVYLPGRTGCRIEDTLVLLPEGNRVLNQHPKQRLGETVPPLL